MALGGIGAGLSELGLPVLQPMLAESRMFSSREDRQRQSTVMRNAYLNRGSPCQGTWELTGCIHPSLGAGPDRFENRI